jgi:hypothetical protein
VLKTPRFKENIFKLGIIFRFYYYSCVHVHSSYMHPTSQIDVHSKLNEKFNGDAYYTI